MDTCQIKTLPNGYLTKAKEIKIVDGLEIRFLSRANQENCQSMSNSYIDLGIIKMAPR